MSDPDDVALTAAALLLSALGDRNGCALLAAQAGVSDEVAEVLWCLSVLSAEMSIYLAGPEIPARMLDVVVAEAEAPTS